ncbi:MAG: nucleoside triphosphate pyrophosphohydrolase [Clostridia bacterium]|nr:nucleoside triphosphate pyrophosphohydrolase [Clostridia bacterium]
MDRYIVSAGSLLANRAFSAPVGATLEVTDVTPDLFERVKAKLLHILGDEVCTVKGRTARLSEQTAAEGSFGLCFPPRDFLKKTRFDFNDLIYVIHRLRDEDGCEWDKVQTHESIRENAVEEAYELVEAINNRDLDNMREETGDVLLQGAFHAVIAEDGGEYDVSDGMSELCAKLIFRHPHVFGEIKAKNQEEALAAWEQAKMKEKKQKSASERMTHVAGTLPQPMRAAKVQKYAASVGFDFPTAEEAATKVTEELAELLAAGEKDKEMEGGDLLFAAINVLRLRKINPEMALLRSTDKFVRRFTAVERRVEAMGADIRTLGLAKLDEIYNQVKNEE